MPLLNPVAPGVNVTENVHVPCAGIVAQEDGVAKSVGFAPPKLTELIVAAKFPLFVTVTVKGADVTLITVLGKLIDVGAAESVVVNVPIPMPVTV